MCYMYFHSQTRTDQARLIQSRSRGRRPQIKNATQIVFGTCAAPSAEVNTNPRRHTLTHTDTHIALIHSRQGVDKQGRRRGLAWAALRSNWISRLGRNMQKKKRKDWRKRFWWQGGHMAGWLPLISLSPLARHATHTHACPLAWSGLHF